MAEVDKLESMQFVQHDYELTLGTIITLKGFGEIDGTPFRVEYGDKPNSFKLVEVKPL